MVMAAAAAASASASASEDHEMLLNRFMPYGSSQLFLEQSGTPASSSLVPANGSGGSSSGSSSSLVSSSSLRDSHPHSNVSRSRSDAAASVIYGSIPDVISLDWPRRGPTNGQAFITNNRRTLKELCALVIGFRCEWDGRWGEKKRTKTFVKRRIKLLCTEKKNLFSVLLLYINNRTLPTQWVTSVGIFSMDTEDVFHCSVLFLVYLILYLLYVLLFYFTSNNYFSQSNRMAVIVIILFSKTLSLSHCLISKGTSSYLMPLSCAGNLLMLLSYVGCMLYRSIPLCQCKILPRHAWRVDGGHVLFQLHILSHSSPH